MTPQQHQDRPRAGHLAKLYALRAKVDEQIAAEVLRQTRIAAIAAGIDVPADEDHDAPAGRLLRLGGSRIPDAYTEDQARDAHTMFRAGNRDTWVVDAERQYQRNRKRISRERQSA